MADYEEEEGLNSEINESIDDLGLALQKKNSGRESKKEKNKGNFNSIKSLTDFKSQKNGKMNSTNSNGLDQKKKKKNESKYNEEKEYEMIDDTFCLNKNGFIIFNEDEIEISNNNKKDIEEIFESNKNVKTKRRKTFTSAIKHGSQLNTIISKLNENRKASGKKEFDKNNVCIKLTYDQLDKFKQKKTMKDLTVEICYSIE